MIVESLLDAIPPGNVQIIVVVAPPERDAVDLSDQSVVVLDRYESKLGRDIRKAVEEEVAIAVVKHGEWVKRFGIFHIGSIRSGCSATDTTRIV